MAKTKFVRVAVSGPTIDGRVIDPAQLKQAAKNYNRDTYAARINLEHIRGFSGDKPFGMYGDVLSLKTEDIKLDVAGKQEDRVALLAELDVSDDLVALNKGGTGQKLYSSVELLPNFSGTNEAYLVGIAATDSPASLGTERLQFSARNFGTLISQKDELALVVPEPTPAESAQTEVAGFFTSLKTLIEGFGKSAPATPPAPAVTPPAPAANPASPDLNAFGLQIVTGFEKLNAAITASKADTDAQVKKVSDDLAALTARLETTPASGYSRPPVATGGNGTILAEY